MARTGVDISVSDSVFGSQPKVNANTMLVVDTGRAKSLNVSGKLAFELDTPYMIYSPNDLDKFGITEENNPDIVKVVNQFYAPRTGINNNGTLVWLIGATAANATAMTQKRICDWVRSTVVNGFQYRPRQLCFVTELSGEKYSVGELEKTLQGAIDELLTEGFACCGIVTYSGSARMVSSFPDATQFGTPFVSTVIYTDISTQTFAFCNAAQVAGLCAALSVGTSIGDASLPPFSGAYYVGEDGVLNCASLSLNDCNSLGDKGLIFLRTRPPKNGLWPNDGATGNDPANALSTLEAVRTLCALVDDLREYFTPFINNRIPVDSTGDIQASYKQVVLDNARAFVITPYIQSGDISDARIDLQAENNDMVGTRTWKVTLSVLPAPTLRWIDGFVFYVKSL